MAYYKFTQTGDQIQNILNDVKGIQDDISHTSLSGNSLASWIRYEINQIDLNSYVAKSEVQQSLNTSTLPVSSVVVKNECQNIREVVEGKCKSIVISYQTTAPTTDQQAQALTMPDGTHFASLLEFEDYVEDEYTETAGVCINNLFNSDINSLDVGAANYYLITASNVVLKYDYGAESGNKQFGLSTGDIILVVETNVPKRWFDYGGDTANILDTTNYATDLEAKNALGVE